MNAEVDVKIPMRLRSASLLVVFTTLALFAGCHKKEPPHADAASVAAVQQEAQREVEQAKVEAKKDVKSEMKIMGADSKDVARAKVTGAFDVAMARADGAHKVAIEQCLLLQPSAQQPCKDSADSDYQAAVAKAKENRAAQQP